MSWAFPLSASAASAPVRSLQPTPQTIRSRSRCSTGVVGGLNRKHGFLYTLERDEVVDAVNMLTVRLSDEARAALDPVLEEALEEALDD